MRSQAKVSSELAEYDAIALREGSNEVAAKARFAKATTMLTRFDGLARETGNPDPTETWLEVLAIVRDLESGRYPPGPWVDERRHACLSFSLYQKLISPSNAARLLEALRLFAVEHETVLAESYNPIVGLVTYTMPALAAFLPDGAAVMDRQFTELGRELRDPAAAGYLKARWLDQVQAPSPSRWRSLRVRRRTKPTCASCWRPLPPLPATASMPGWRWRIWQIGSPEDPASLDLAHAHFEEYLRRFGSGPVAALAALRLGHVEQGQGRHGDAATRFAGVARANRNEPMVRVLASPTRPRQ